MPPKKEKKKKDKASEEPIEEDEAEMELKNVDKAMLQELVPMLRQQLEKSMLDRNYVQLERDSIQGFYDTTKKEIEDVESQIEAKERAMEGMRENHRTELQVYRQKISHLEYEHTESAQSAESSTLVRIESEQSQHSTNLDDAIKSRISLKREILEQEVIAARKVTELHGLMDKNVNKMRDRFESSLVDLKTRCDERLAELEREMELRRRTELHEVEERRNSHINDLVHTHERAFKQMRDYYNDVTKGNLQLIKSLKDRVAELKAKSIDNQRLLHEYTLENEKLAQPLAELTTEVTELKNRLRDKDKDIMTLNNAKARLVRLQEEMSTLRKDHEGYQQRLFGIQTERDELRRNFQQALSQVKVRASEESRRLEQAAEDMKDHAELVSCQLREVSVASGLNPSDIERICIAVSNDSQVRTEKSEELRFQILKKKKKFNSVLALMQSKMSEMGIPNEEIQAMKATQMVRK